jgi:uncharacterized protein (UPF0332 family)
MSDSTATVAKSLLFLSRLSKTEKCGLYAIDQAFPELGLGGAFRSRLKEAIAYRLRLGMEFRLVAERLSKSEDTGDLRIAINRGYYSVHHSIRAMLLKRDEYETDGHTAAIEELKKILKKDSQEAARIGLDLTIFRKINEAKNNRSVADYSPYVGSRTEATADSISITGNDWRAAAQFNAEIAADVSGVAQRFTGVID